MTRDAADDGGFTQRRCAFAVFALSVLALVARLATLDFALPFQQEPDAHILGQIAVLAQPEVSDHDLYYTAIYPHLIARLALWTGAHATPQGLGPEATLDEHLAAASALHLHVRALVALLSILIIPAAWWIARAFLERKWALFAAALTATSTLALQFGQMARPHAVAAALIALSVAAALRLRRRGDTSSFLLASAVTALAIGCLQNAAAVLFASLAAVLLRENARRRVLDVRLVIPVASIALSIAYFWPFLFVPTPAEELAGATVAAPSDSWALVRVAVVALCCASGVFTLIAQTLKPTQGARRVVPFVLLVIGAGVAWTLRGQVLHIGWQTIDLKDFDGGGAKVVSLTLWFYEPLALALALAGVFAWLSRGMRGRREVDLERSKDFIVVVSYAVPYLLVLVLFRIVQQRFMLPLIPFIACAAAYGTRELTALFARRVASVALVALALAVPTLACAGYWRMRTRPQTLEQLAQWIREQNARAPIQVALHKLYDVPLARNAANLAFGAGEAADLTPWLRYQGQAMSASWSGERFDLEPLFPRDELAWIRGHADEYLATLRADFVVVPAAEGGRVNPLIDAFRAALARAGWTSVLRLPSESRPPSAGLDGLDTPHFTYFVLTRTWFGPQLDVFRRPQPAR